MVVKPDAGGRMVPWARGLLIASLTLNILMVGLAAGWALRHGWPQEASHSARMDLVGGPLTRALSEVDRREIGRRMRQAQRERGDFRQEMRAGFEALVDNLRAVPFDPERMAATMRAQRKGVAERFDLGQQVLIEHLAQMSDAERGAYADRVQARIDEDRAQHGHRPKE